MSTLRVDTLQAIDDVFQIDVKDLANSADVVGLVNAAELANVSDITKGAALVGFKGRTVWSKLGDTVSVKDHGAVGDGVTDDTAAFTAAIAELGAAGGEIYVPRGVYRVDQVAISISTVAFYGYHVGFRGEGPAISVIKGSAALASDENLVSIFANTAGGFINSLIFGVTVANIGFEAVGLTGNTFSTTNSAYMNFTNCYFSYGNRAFYSEGCLSSTFTNCKFSYGNYGFYALPGFSFPNQLTFNQCVIGSNVIGGLYAKNPGGIRMFGGSVEGNGEGNVSGFGVILDHAAGSSAGTAIAGTFVGTYFEFNNGIADLYVGHNNPTENLGLGVYSCSFACGGVGKITTDRIRIEHLSTTALHADIRGNNFQELAGFVPTVGQKYINVFGGGSGLRSVCEGGNYFNHPNSFPTVGTVDSSIVGRGKRLQSGAGVTNVSGNLFIVLNGFTSTPSITGIVVDGTPATIYSVRLTAQNSAGATFEVFSQPAAGGAWVAASTVSVNWMASGT